MKKLCLSLVIIIITTLSVNAQIQYGAKGGLNIASFTGTASGGTSAIVGINLGGLVLIPVEDKFAIQPELYFSMQGGKSTSTSEQFDLNYFNVPVLAKYTIVNGFALEAGPQLGFLLAAHDKFNGTSTDVKANFKSTDFAFVFGANYQLPKQNLGFDIRFNAGISNLSSSSTNTLHNSVVQIGAFYFFNTK
jgi:outer membrane protein with beta-barrel domain